MNETPQKLMSWVVPTAASILFTSIAGAVLWGQYSQRVSSLELEQHELLKQQSDSGAKLAAHDTQIAVIDQKLDTIIQQLATANAKLDQVKK